jgi:hypothetical protein
VSDLLVLRSRFEDRLRRINADLPVGATEIGELYRLLYNHRHEIADIVAAAREHWIEGGDSARLAKQATDALRRLDES